MPQGLRLPRDFFARDTLLVAPELLGARLVRLENGQRLGGAILEAEAYRGEEDMGCHARAGLTPRTQVMYGSPGHAYVYFTYGMHWMLNFVTQLEGFPAAVLIRAILPLEGKDVTAARRNPQPPHSWTDGPAKLCKALGIDGTQNGLDMCSDESEIFVEKKSIGSCCLPPLFSAVRVNGRRSASQRCDSWLSCLIGGRRVSGRNSLISEVGAAMSQENLTS